MNAAAPPLSSRRGRRLCLVIVIVAALLFAGCSTLSGDGSSLPSGTTAAEQYRSLDGFSATMTVEQSNSPDKRLRVWIDPDDARSRSERLAPESQAGNIAVANDSVVVQYNATTNEYIRISTSGTDRFERGAQRIADAVTVARSDGKTTTDSPPFGGGPLPVVPDSGEQSSETQFVVSYDGTDTVAGRTAHVINYTAAGDRSTGVLRQTIWLDSQYFVTIKATRVSRFDGNRSSYTFQLSNVSFDTNFRASRFQFDPPDDAMLNESDSFDLTSYDSLSTLANATSIAVPEPAVPERYSLIRADRIDGATLDAVQMRYRDGTSSIIVTKTTEQSYSNTSEGEPIRIAGETARYRSTGVQSVIVWECYGYIYTVVGDVQKETLVEVSTSVACT